MVIVAVTAVILLLTLFYFYIKRAYFTLNGPIPGIPPQILFGNLLQTGVIGKKVAFNLVFLHLKSKFGDVFQYWLGPSRVVVVSRLEDVQHIFSHRNIYGQADLFTKKISFINPYALLFLRGAAYKRHFDIVSPLLHRNKSNNYLETTYDCTDKLLSRWRIHNNDSKYVHLNMIEQCQQLSFAIFGYVCLDYDFQTLDDEFNRNKNELAESIHLLLDGIIICIQLPTILSWIYFKLNPKYRRARSIVNRYLQKMIEQELREKSEMRDERKRISIIDSLVNSLQQDEKLETTKSEENKKGLSQDEIIGAMFSLLSAGYSTVAASLIWFIFFISKNPHVQNKLKKELSQYDRQRLSIEQLESLQYLDNVLREVFRLTPPIVGVVRTLINDDHLSATGVHLNKGDQVFISFYNLNQDERYCQGTISPDQFYPERFLIESNDKNKKLIPMTFGGEHRQCIGQDLARVELKAICARLLQYVTFGDGGDKLNAGGYKQTDTILPKHMGVTITFD